MPASVPSVLEGNRDFYEYTSLDLFDAAYFAVPQESEQVRAGYEAKVAELTESLTEDMEKAEAIHRWVSENVYYDYDHYYHPGTNPSFYTANQVYENRRGVCEGYAALLTEMLRCAGIPARHVLGYGINTVLTAQELLDIYNKGNTNHAWTEFYCNGKWYFADATWDSRNKYENQTFIPGSYRGEYFALDVEEYSRTHIPVYYYDEFSTDDFIIHVTKKASEIREYKGNGGVVEIPEELRITKVSGFAGNTDITEVIIPEGVLSAGSYDGCTSLKKITLPQSLTGLGSFDGCSALESIVIPDGVTSISGFEGCSSLKSVHIGKGVKSLNSYIFEDCLSLETVTGGENLKSLSGYAFYNCPLLKDCACFHNLNYVDSRAFYKCSAMKTIILTDRTEALYDYSFYQMSALETVIIPSGNKYVKSIGYAAFYRCTSLETLVIPSTVTSIDEHAFNGTSNLKTILFEGTQEQWDAITVGNYNYGLANATVVCLGDHTHAFSEKEDIKATCVSEGKVTYTCQCTDEYALTYSKLTHISDHDYAFVKNDATCEEDGKTVYSCKNCADTYTEVITSQGHDFEDEYTVDKEATCKEEGSKSRHCKNCDEITDVTVLEKDEHEFTEIIAQAAATCTEEGSITLRCICGEEKTEKTEKNKLNHKGETELRNQKTSTCGEDGYTGDVYCKACGELVSKGKETQATEKHSYSSSVAKEPDCSNSGLIVYSCADCSSTYNETISALGHKDENGDYKCDYSCGYEYEKPSQPDEPDTPDTPDEPADDNCGHMCHKKGFVGFIWKIVQFFCKLFKMNPVCQCGAAHY